MSDINIGFNRIKEVKATKKSEDKIDLKKLDEVAENVGFESREVTKRLSMKRTPKPKTSLSIRIDVDDYNKFAQFAKDNNFTQEQALLSLLNKI